MCSDDLTERTGRRFCDGHCVVCSYLRNPRNLLETRSRYLRFVDDEKLLRSGRGSTLDSSTAIASQVDLFGTVGFN